MDILAHGLWTNAVFEVASRMQRGKGLTRRERWFAVFFGIAPDFFAFALPVATSLFGNGTLDEYARSRFAMNWHGRSLVPLGLSPEVHSLSLIPPYVFDLYNISHSFVVFLSVFMVAWVVMRRVYWPLAGWGLHVFIDTWSHSELFFPTPIFYPISRFRMSGVSWSEPYFMVINYAVIAFVYILLYYVLHKRKRRRAQ